MANKTIYPYGTDGQLPSSIGIINDLTTGGADKALSAEMGKEIGVELFGDFEPKTVTPVMQQGVYNAYTGEWGSSLTRICTGALIRSFADYQVSIWAGYKFNVLLYDKDGVFVEAVSLSWMTATFSGTHDGYIHINVANSSDTNIAPSASTGLQVTVGARGEGMVEQVAELNGDVYGTDSDTPETRNLILEQGGMLADGTKDPIILNTRVRTVSPVRVYGAFSLSITEGYNYNIFFYRTSALSSFQTALGVWEEGTYSGDYDGYIMVNVKKADDGNLTPTSVTCTLTQAARVPGLKDKVDDLDFTPNGYMYGASLIKQPVRTKELGTLDYLQAFCVYDGKYYSINGTYISEQDADFSTLRSGSLNTGHGNALQLGHNGLAYASGWDDQKIYVVDLATLTISSTITLPTTGYTTCAVDDVRKLTYIFQRDSYPNTVASYNFIVYDYDNQQIISTSVLDEPFSAMQACDYLEGKIAVVYGGGTVQLPSGMKVYDTAGNVLAVYDLDIFAEEEPEGICFDRSDWRLLVSDVNKKVYQVYIKE